MKQEWNLLTPCRIGGITVKNRIVMPPMNTNFSNLNGEVTAQTLDYYTARARGGCGLIVVDATSIDPKSKKHGLQPMLYDEKFLPGYAKLTERIHRYGAKASIEIIHYGSETPYPEGETKLSASDVSSIAGNPVRPMTVEEILHVEDQFVQTAEYAKLAGFDAVTYHATHGYLIAQFLSPLYNKRTDEYGGSFENRFRFLREIVEKTRAKLGDRFPVMVRFSADEYIEGGRTLQESVQLAKALEACGAAAIDISAAVPSSYMFTIAPGSLTGMKGLQRENARAIKAAVNIPVLVAGGIRDPEMAEAFLRDGVADLICLGRAQLADPDYVNKLQKGQAETIRPCISCLTCFYSLGEKKCLRCAVNPETGREYEKRAVQRADGQKAVVVGAGPAGMEAALTLAERGYQTAIYEKRDHLGGSLHPASVPTGKSDIGKLITWFENQLEDRGVRIYRDTPYTEDIDRDYEPNLLVDATGGTFSRRIAGSDGPAVMTAVEALSAPDAVGSRVVIIGAGNTGCETAEVLSGQGKKLVFRRVKDMTGTLEYDICPAEGREREVILVEFMPQYGAGIGRLHRPLLEARLKEGGVKVMVSTKVNRISENGDVEIANMADGTICVIHADTVILAGGMQSESCSVKTVAERVVKIGDARMIGKIESAIADGYFMGKEM